MTLLFAGAAVALAAASIVPLAPRWPELVSHRGTRERRSALPGLIEALGAALSSGLSLSQAFAEVAPVLPASLAAPTRRTAAALALGVRLDDALASYRGAIPAEDLAPLAIVLGAFERTGGRIARSLTRVAALLRGRLALEDEQAALTAQGRVSAMVLVLLAPLGATFLATAMPDYVAVLTGEGRGLLVLAVALEAAAALWLRHLLRAPTTGSSLAALLDAVVVGLASGMTFERALREVVMRAPAVGRLPEARRLLADLALGQGSRRAFGAFASAGAAEARVASLIASSARFGAPLADLLVVQADALREADRRRAEAAARRLPVLMLFPLTFCVLPAVLIVFLGPPLLSIR